MKTINIIDADTIEEIEHNPPEIITRISRRALNARKANLIQQIANMEQQKLDTQDAIAAIDIELTKFP